MLRLIPAPLHRALYRVAHRVRMIFWRIAKPQLQASWVIGRDIDGKLLLLRLSYGEGAWELPGGGVGKAETPEDAARRELLEETGCEALALAQVGVIEDTVAGAPSRNYIFTAMIEDHPVADGREVIEARFFPTHSLPAPLSAKTQKRLDFHLSRKTKG